MSDGILVQHGIVVIRHTGRGYQPGGNGGLGRTIPVSTPPTLKFDMLRVGEESLPITLHHTRSRLVLES
jgi:hypothetical protein